MKEAWREVADGRLLPAGLLLVGVLSAGTGVYHFRARTQEFDLLMDLLGCALAVLAALVALLILDYTLHHAFVVFIPWCLLVLFLAWVEPHFAVGLGVALWCLLVPQRKMGTPRVS